jgi:hypothetical protein
MTCNAMSNGKGSKSKTMIDKTLHRKLGINSCATERAFVALFVASHRGHEKLVRRLIDAGKCDRFYLF